MEWLYILFAVGGACLIGAMVPVICWCMDWSIWTKGTTKISFKKFKQFYNINPDRWVLGYFTVTYRFNKKESVFHFNLIDFHRYHFWDKKIERAKAKAKKTNLDTKALSLLISGVALDIEELKSKGIKEIEEAKQSILAAQTTAQN